VSWLRTVVRGDRGGFGALAAVLLAGGVLLGATALVVDVGRLHAERAELQNGADAAAMALAEQCARSASVCASTGPALAAGYANDNASDGTAAVRTVCGLASGTSLAACPSVPSGTVGCLNAPPSGVSWVEVRTGTRTLDGGTLLPPVVAQTLAGEDSYDGTEVTACARAAWGSPMGSTGLAVTASICQWNEITGSGANLPAQGTVPAQDGVLYLHGTAEATNCTTGPSGAIAPGGFGWLNETGPCKTTIRADGSYGGSTGVSASQNCKTALEDARTNHTILYVPIYDALTGTGSGTVFHLLGMAAFVLTGYELSGLSAKSTLTNQKYCTGSKKCLYGYFTEALMPAAGTLGGPDFGAWVVTLVG
jgi:hypothetical protein